VGVRCGGGTADALKRQNPWPFFGQGFVFRRGLPRLSPPYGQGGFGWVFVVVAAKTTPLNDKTPGLFWSGVRFPPGLAPAKPSLRLGRVWVGVRCGGGTADALKRQNPWPFFGQGFVFRRGLPRQSPPYG